MNSSRQTDFIDSDLQAPRIPRPDFEAEETASRSRLGQLQRQREHLEQEVADTARELQSLHQQQESLLKRKQTLESLRQRQEQYVTEKQELSRRLHQCLLLLDKEEVRVSQLQELYQNSRNLFSRLEQQLEELEEGGWDEEVFDQKLSHASDVVKGVRIQFKKSLARLDAMDWNSEQESAEDLFPVQGFAFWLKVGFAVGLPIALLCGLSALAVVWILTGAGSGP
ncbi:MAG: hypothetical protein ACO3N7_10300 [Kiritimatiellia bacterium]